MGSERPQDADLESAVLLRRLVPVAGVLLCSPILVAKLFSAPSFRAALPSLGAWQSAYFQLAVMVAPCDLVSEHFTSWCNHDRIRAIPDVRLRHE